jgi:hypothetical protein|tara:strand:- start:3881 stop:4435 length:555 start_codon:yes stop_codon:yes gene_type:complete
MNVKDVIENIVKTKSIVDYLSNKGIEPSRHLGNKYIYNSPLPQVKGKDSTPSFFVYDKGDRQDFFCYSSKVGGNIITLHSCMSGKGFVESLKDFHDFESVDDITLQIAIDKMTESMFGSDDADDFNSEFLKFSLSIRNYIKIKQTANDFNSNLNVIWEKMEDIIDSENIEGLKKLNSEVVSYYG